MKQNRLLSAVTTPKHTAAQTQKTAATLSASYTPHTPQPHHRTHAPVTHTPLSRPFPFSSTHTPTSTPNTFNITLHKHELQSILNINTVMTEQMQECYNTFLSHIMATIFLIVSPEYFLKTRKKL